MSSGVEEPEETEYLDDSFTQQALRDLRVARRKNRLLDIHWSDALYRVYVIIIGVGGLSWWVTTELGTHDGSASRNLAAFQRGPAIVGLTISIGALMALRSGSRGGPLAIEATDLHYVLQAPIDRGITLRRPLIHQLRRGLVTGVIVGLIAGRMAMSFFPGSAVVWMGLGALSGGAVGAALLALAATTCGLQMSVQSASGVGLALVAWSAIDVFFRTATSPFAVVGRAPLWALSGVVEGETWPIGGSTAGLVMLCVLTIGAILAAFRRVGGVRLEQVDRRAALVGQLRFAASTQDLRAVMLLRRQLTSERSRATPLFAVPSRSGAERAVLVRGMRSVARWPNGRITRSALLATVAGLASRATWEGVYPLVAVAGLAMFVLGLDAVEPLAQDADHIEILAMLPRHRGRLANRQLIVPAVVVGLFGVFAAAVATLSGPLFSGGVISSELFFGSVIVSLLTSVAATAGAGLSVAMGPPSLLVMLQTPELGMARTMLAPGMAVGGVAAPLLWGIATLHTKNMASAFPGIFRGGMAVAFVCYFALTWLTDGGIRDPKI